MLRFQEEEIDRLMMKIQKQSETIKSILKEPKLLTYYKMAKNKEIEYIDSNNNEKVIKVEHPQDIYQIMLDMFQLQN
jgi:hypothetical protein